MGESEQGGSGPRPGARGARAPRPGGRGDRSATSERAIVMAELEQLRRENRELLAELAVYRDEPERRPARGRRVIAIILAVLITMLIPLAATTVWLRTTLLDTDDYVDTVTPLASDAAIQAAVASRVAFTIVAAADLEGAAAEALPGEARILAPFVARGGSALVEAATLAFLETDGFAQLWREAHRTAHSTVVGLLAGHAQGPVVVDEGRVIVPLGDIVDRVATDLEEATGFGFGELVAGADTTLVLAESDELARASDFLRFIDRAGWWVVIVTAVFVIAMVAIAPERSRALLWLGVATGVAALVSLIALSWSREGYESALASDVTSPEAAMAAFDILTRYLFRSFRVLFAAGLLLAAVGWVLGPGERATGLRGRIGDVVDRAARRPDDRAAGVIGRVVADHQRVLVYLVCALAAVVLVAWDKPTVWVVLAVALATSVVLAVVALMARWGRDSSDEPIGAS